jgi:hypothetical protein
VRDPRSSLSGSKILFSRATYRLDKSAEGDVELMEWDVGGMKKFFMNKIEKHQPIEQAEDDGNDETTDDADHVGNLLNLSGTLLGTFILTPFRPHFPPLSPSSVCRIRGKVWIGYFCSVCSHGDW